MTRMTAPVRRTALLVLIGLVLATWWPAASARENESFGVTPYPEEKDGVDRIGFQIPLETGATFEDAVKIYNRTNQTLPLAIYPADAEATEEEITAGFRTNDPKGVGTWIDLARGDVELAPRGEVVVTFRVHVKTADPSPNLGAIVVEHTSPGLPAAQRLHLVVRTVPPNTATTSVRVRPLLIRSPWVIIATAGLLVAIALVWVGTRRARRSKDILVPAGELEGAIEEAPIVPEASRPVIKRLGVTEGAAGEARAATAVLDRPRRRAKTDKSDDRPLLDDAFLVEVEPPEDEVTDEGAEDSFDDEPDEDAEADEVDELDDADLPPAQHRERRPRTSRNAAPSRTRKTARKTSPRKASAPQRKVSPAAGKAATRKRAANASSKKRNVKTAAAKRNYIPLDEL
jgi:hypothetical protein